MFKKYKNISAFLVISFCLLVPFVVIKTLGGDYEIFPAAIFPGGADRKHIGDEILVPSLELFGKNRDSGKIVELNKRFLFKKIYIHHMIYFIRGGYFGALSYANARPKDTIAVNPYAAYATKEDIIQTKEWLKKGLLEQNCSDSVLIVRFTELRIDKVTGKINSDIVENERILELY